MSMSMMTSWRDGIVTALDSSERQVEGLGRRFDAVAKRFEKKTRLQVVQLKKQVGFGQRWLKTQISRLKIAETKAETVVEASLVMMHFAQKDAKDMLAMYKNRYLKACAKLGSRHHKAQEQRDKAKDRDGLRNSGRGADGIPLADRQR